MSRTSLAHKIILFALALILMGSTPLFADKARTVVIFPLALYGDPSKAYLREGLRNMLLSRLSGGDIKILGDEAIQSRLAEKERQGVLTRSRAEALARAIKADYAIYGGITTVGTGYSIDLTLLELKEGMVRSSNISEALEESELIKKIADIAFQFRSFVEGRDIWAERLAVSAPFPGGEGAGTGGLFQRPARPAPDLRPTGRLTIRMKIMAFDAGDVDGDGISEWLVLGRDKLLVYARKGKALETLGTLEPGRSESFLKVSAGDADDNGRAEIYLVGRYGTRARTTVWEWDGSFKKLYRITGHIKALKVPGRGKPLLFFQDSKLGSFFHGRIYLMDYDGRGNLERRRELPSFKKGVQFYALIPLDVSTPEPRTFLGLDGDSYLRIWDREGKILWTGAEEMGGSENIINVEADRDDPGLPGKDTLLNGRIILMDLDGDGKREVLAVKNIRLSNLLKDLLVYTKARLFAFKVQPSALVPAWTSRTVKYVINDIQADGSTLVIAASKSRGTGQLLWFK
ncbi:MAG: VCBS repeat-containing protein [Deltaproteobacteria bacterium]|nr:VCBS repeat-containing protein [Deltaproteobacteria bacterium]